MTKDEIEHRISQLDKAIANYEELECDIENPEYIARGNGFCDSKYSEEFIQGQIERLKEERRVLMENKNENKNQQ